MLENEKEIFIHIGYPKTATTTLQNNLFPNHSELNYLRKGGNNLHLIHDAFFSRENSFKKNINKYKEELLKVTQNQVKGKFVYSEESLTSFSMFFRFQPRPYIWTLEPNSIARKLKIAFSDTDVFDCTKITVTIRKQDDMIKSMYAQVYNFVFKKFRETKTFKRFLNYSLHEVQDNFIVDSLHYDEVISEYETLFGEDNICVLVFEEFKKDKLAYINKLCIFMNIDEKEALRLVENKHSNKRSSLNGYKSDERNLLEILQYYKNKYLGNKSLGLGNSKFIELMKSIYIPGKTLHDLDIDTASNEKLYKLYSKGNKKLSEKYNLNLKEYGYFYE